MKMMVVEQLGPRGRCMQMDVTQLTGIPGAAAFFTTRAGCR